MIFWLKVAKENVGLDSVVRDQFLLFFEKYGFYLVKICGARPPPPSDPRTASTLAHALRSSAPHPMCALGSVKRNSAPHPFCVLGSVKRSSVPIIF